VTENNKRWLAWTISVLATLAISLFFGVQYPIPDQPSEPVEPIELGANFSNPIDIEDSASAAAPALTFQDDTDTGFWRSAADTLNAATGGTEQLELDASEFTVVPPANFSGNVTAGAALAVTGDTTLGADLVLSSQTLTVTTAGDVITPTGAFVNLNADNAVTCTIADGSTAGQILILYNDGDSTATIEEASYNADTGGDISFTTDDSLILIWTGTLWTRLTTMISN